MMNRVDWRFSGAGIGFNKTKLCVYLRSRVFQDVVAPGCSSNIRVFKRYTLDVYKHVVCTQLMIHVSSVSSNIENALEIITLRFPRKTGLFLTAVAHFNLLDLAVLVAKLEGWKALQSGSPLKETLVGWRGVDCKTKGVTSTRSNLARNANITVLKSTAVNGSRVCFQLHRVC